MRRSQALLPGAERKQLRFSFYAPAVTRCMTRGFITTAKGLFGLAPGRAEVGDLVCLLKGGTVPFILRQEIKKETDSEVKWSFVGEAYIYGVMNGEVLARYGERGGRRRDLAHLSAPIHKRIDRERED